MITLITRRLGLGPYFDILISANEVEQGKPFPDIFLRAAAYYQADPSVFVVIEDSTNAIKGAKLPEYGASVL